MPLPVLGRILVLGQGLRLTIRNSHRIEIPGFSSEFCNTRKRINGVKNHVARENATNFACVCKKRPLKSRKSYIYIYILCGRLSEQAPIANIDRVPHVYNVYANDRSPKCPRVVTCLIHSIVCFWRTRCAPWKIRNYVTSRKPNTKLCRRDKSIIFTLSDKNFN